MELTSDTETRQTTMTVTVRVPNGADGGLTTDAQRRLSRVEGVLAVTIEDLCRLQPGLSATEVTVRVTIETDIAPPARSITASLSELTGVTPVES
ncbi:hypothetical protein [Haloarcula argentinensis]|uniref:Uncharacterized protein n=1 Tax=Haloarcula argentinensis TaxID=43776 RepID=A0ABU2EZX3_HALAR|nr:hypothetical protein [Haloarcula argentinensis]EMA18670.1 hypothetical protein C443_19279 [Haloarcula argentinensis DSM 12282]MDS0253767.1 hypothetical protein [Haloarcula argentinensis]